MRQTMQLDTIQSNSSQEVSPGFDLFGPPLESRTYVWRIKLEAERKLPAWKFLLRLISRWPWLVMRDMHLAVSGLHTFRKPTCNALRIPYADSVEMAYFCSVSNYQSSLNSVAVDGELLGQCSISRTAAGSSLELGTGDSCSPSKDTA